MTTRSAGGTLAGRTEIVTGAASGIGAALARWLAADGASPFKAAYVSAKHGLEGLSRVIALEGATHGVTSNCVTSNCVTSNCVNPAYVRTPLVEGQIADQATTHGLDEATVVEDVMLSPVAVKRLIEPDEVAELAAVLYGPASGSISGTSLSIDGGWTAL